MSTESHSQQHMGESPDQQQDHSGSQVAQDYDGHQNHAESQAAPIDDSTQHSGAAAQQATTNSGKLFVGQVPAVCTEEMLVPLFQPYGVILEVKVMRDHQGRSKGCAWVRYETQAMAQAAIDALHEKHAIPPQTNALRVQYALQSKPHGNSGGQNRTHASFGFRGHAPNSHHHSHHQMGGPSSYGTSASSFQQHQHGLPPPSMHAHQQQHNYMGGHQGQFPFQPQQPGSGRQHFPQPAGSGGQAGAPMFGGFSSPPFVVQSHHQHHQASAQQHPRAPLMMAQAQQPGTSYMSSFPQQSASAHPQQILSAPQQGGQNAFMSQYAAYGQSSAGPNGSAPPFSSAQQAVATTMLQPGVQGQWSGAPAPQHIAFPAAHPTNGNQGNTGFW